ncbi:MAG TPA: universal stress protein [Acidimicrobiales bacterium]|nr:universal stress protein [Acidimicrobiales bacterium]
MPGDEQSTKWIAVGMDGSEPSRNALRWAAGQAELTGSSLRIVMTWEHPAAFGWPVAYPEDFDPEQETANAMRAAVSEVLGEDPPCPIELVVEEGHPGPTLVEVAKGCDLLVVGSRGHGAFTGMILGSVSEYCAAHSPVPVVIVRRDEATHNA